MGCRMVPSLPRIARGRAYTVHVEDHDYLELFTSIKVKMEVGARTARLTSYGLTLQYLVNISARTKPCHHSSGNGQACRFQGGLQLYMAAPSHVLRFQQR